MRWQEQNKSDSNPVSLAPGEAHLWTWRLAGNVSHDDSSHFLSAAETTRAGAFKFARDRNNYLLSHVLRRLVLSRYLSCAPETITFGEGVFGKPFLLYADQNLQFNLSHSSTTALLAITSGDAIGVDVEDIQAIDAKVSEQSFSHSESADLASLRKLSDEAWLQGFYNCWTRKEAVLKAEGTGLNVRLDSFDVSLLPGQPAKILRLSIESGLSRHWQLVHCEPSRGVVAAIATVNNCNLRYFRLHCE